MSVAFPTNRSPRTNRLHAETRPTKRHQFGLIEPELGPDAGLGESLTSRLAAMGQLPELADARDIALHADESAQFANGGRDLVLDPFPIGSVESRDPEGTRIPEANLLVASRSRNVGTGCRRGQLRSRLRAATQRSSRGSTRWKG